MLIVENDPVAVEADLVAGRLACPGCESRLLAWGHARWRTLRGEFADGVIVCHRHRPRRSLCSGCGITHVLLADIALLRRVDSVAVIGAALLASALGTGHRRIAAAIGRQASTVRSWLRRLRRRSEAIRSWFITWAHTLDPELVSPAPAVSALADALEAIGAAARAASLRLGPRPAWSWASALSGGTLLSNTNTPLVSAPRVGEPRSLAFGR